VPVQSELDISSNRPGSIQVFVSYSRTDRVFVDRLVADLERLNFSVWIDRRGIKAGRQWDNEIVSAIKRCFAMVVVLSNASVKSAGVADEFSSALDGNLLVFTHHARAV